jgi:hypothetical protein
MIHSTANDAVRHAVKRCSLLFVSVGCLLRANAPEEVMGDQQRAEGATVGTRDELASADAATRASILATRRLAVPQDLPTAESRD